MYKPSKPHKQKIIAEIMKTWKTPYVTVKFNTYPIVQKRFSYSEIDHTDGIGTKGFYHWRKGTFRAAVVDALAMNLNDLAVVRAIPYKLSNHISVPVEDVRIFKIVKELVRVCRRYKIAIVGGENSFHDNMEGLDISMTVSGFIRKLVPNRFCIGDILVGIRSSGLHSNGFTTVRHLFGSRVRSEFTEPTEIYLDAILALIAKYEIHGMVHITGGAFTKIKDILGNADVVLFHPKRLRPQEIFREIYSKGISSKMMYSTFNCGIGFVLSVSPKDAERIVSRLKNADIIGRVIPGDGLVKIHSAFDGKLIKL